MEDWALRGMQRWPNVPALFGWLSLDRRGRWLIKGEVISRPQIIDTINRNYEADAHGRWFFQNGPQRGYVSLDTTPVILSVEAARLVTHTGLPADDVQHAFLDEEGSMVFLTEHGPGALVDNDLEWALARMRGTEDDIESQLDAALAMPSGVITTLVLWMDDRSVPVTRLDKAIAPTHLGFQRDPQPLPGERISTRIAD